LQHYFSVPTVLHCDASEVVIVTEVFDFRYDASMIARSTVWVVPCYFITWLKMPYPMVLFDHISFSFIYFHMAIHAQMQFFFTKPINNTTAWNREECVYT